MSNTRHSLDTSRVGDEEEHGEGFAKLEALEADMLDVLKTNLVMAHAVYGRIEIIKLKERFGFLYKQHTSEVKD